jgi:Lipocalin-like domain
MSELRAGLLGGWRLESFVSRDIATDVERRPYGDNPSGLILYTADGYMSAQLTPDDASEYIAYGGRFHVDEEAATVRHEVLVSSVADLLTRPQLRRARIDGDRLTLSATVTGEGGRTTRGTLVWRRQPGSE